MESCKPEDVRFKIGELIQARPEMTLQEALDIEDWRSGRRVLLGFSQLVFDNLFDLLGLKPDSLVAFLALVPLHGELLGLFWCLVASHLLGTLQKFLEIALLEASFGYSTKKHAGSRIRLHELLGAGTDSPRHC